MKRIVFLSLFLASCLPNKPWVSRLPEPFMEAVRAEGDAIRAASGGHLIRYLVVSRREGRLILSTWDLLRITHFTDGVFPLPVNGSWEVYGFDPTTGQLARVKQGETAGAFPLRKKDIGKGGFCLLFRETALSITNGLLPPVGLLLAPETLRTVAHLDIGSRPAYRLSLPPGYTAREKGALITIIRKRRVAPGGEGHIFFAPGSSSTRFSAQRLYGRLVSRFLSGQRAPLLLRDRAKKKARRVAVDLLYQRACREVDTFGPGFLSDRSGRVRALVAITDGLKQARIPYDLVVPLYRQKGGFLPRPFLGVRINLSGGGLWLFPFSRFAAAGSIPEELRGQPCLILTRNGSKRGRIPVPPLVANQVSLYTKLDCTRSGGASLYYQYRLHGAAAEAARERIRLHPALEAAAQVFPLIFLPRHGVNNSWVRIKHRVPTHHPLQGKGRGGLSGVLEYQRDARINGLSLLKRRYGSMSRAWRQQDKSNPLFTIVHAFQETVRVVLPRGVYAWKMPKQFTVKQGGVRYTGRWEYRPGSPYRKPRRWSWSKWRRWQKKHYTRRRHTLILKRSFQLRSKPVGERASRRLGRLLARIDRWENSGVRLKWK